MINASGLPCYCLCISMIGPQTLFRENDTAGKVCIVRQPPMDNLSLDDQWR